MGVQFELGSKHLDNKKQVNTIISDIKATEPTEIVKELHKKSYGFIPSTETPYADYLGLVVTIEEIAKVIPEAASILVDQVIVQELLKQYGVNNSSFNADEIYALLCAEPGIADLKSLNTKATKNGNNWHIEGIKLVRNDQLNADKYLVYAQDENNQVRIFSLLKEQIKVNKIVKNIANTRINLNQIELNVDAPESTNIAIISTDPEKVLSIARTLIASVSLGIAHSTLATGIASAREVKGPDRQAIAGTQSIQFELADMYAELEASRMLTYYSADLIDNNKTNIKYATMAKVQATDTASQLSIQTLELLGNLGYLGNNDFAEIIRAAVDGQVKGGTNRVQKNQIYQYMLARK